MIFYLKQFLNHKLSLIQSIFTALGGFWLVVQLIDYTSKNKTIEGTSTCFFVCILILFCFCYLIFDGMCVTGFLKKEIKVSDNSTNTIIKVKFGDIFKEEGCIAIAVNEFFDCVVDEKLVSTKSLHGMMLQKVWSGNTSNWYQAIVSNLNESGITGEKQPRECGNSINYPIGTTAFCESKSNNFLCIVLTHTDNNYKACADFADLEKAIDGLLTKARLTCSNSKLSIPLMGSGLSGINANDYYLINFIIYLIVKKSKEARITSEINLVIHESKSSKINLQHLKNMWS